MMKNRILAVAMVLVLSATCVFASSFEGRSTVGLSTNVNYGENYIGLSTDHTGFFPEKSIGYLIAADVDFRLASSALCRINVLLGPVWRYCFASVPVSADLAAGLSTGGTTNGVLHFGLGLYLGGVWSFSEYMELLVGAKLGSNFVQLPLGSSAYLTPDIYLTPRIAVGFRY